MPYCIPVAQGDGTGLEVAAHTAAHTVEGRREGAARIGRRVGLRGGTHTLVEHPRMPESIRQNCEERVSVIQNSFDCT
jgi:hypothetical protein